VLVSGDGDFIPLVRALNKQGVRVVAAHFDYTDSNGQPSFINKRLLNCCHYTVDIAGLDKDREFQNTFKGLFRTEDDWKNNDSEQVLEVITANRS
jgi:uncharacterized LabA/DUF88 family protein